MSEVTQPFERLLSSSGSLGTGRRDARIQVAVRAVQAESWWHCVRMRAVSNPHSLEACVVDRNGMDDPPFEKRRFAGCRFFLGRSRALGVVEDATRESPAVPAHGDV